MLTTLNNPIVVTNSLDVAQILARNTEIKVIGIGGTLRHNTKPFVGHSSVAAVGEYYADKCFICCDGADRDTGITDAHEQEAELRKTMIRNSKFRILTIDKSKFDKISFAAICSWEQIDKVVTDTAPDEAWVKHLDNYSIDWGN